MKEFDIPEPKKIAPELSAEERKAMAPVDLLVQYIMPKLWDRQNMLEWQMKKSLHEIKGDIEFLQGQIDKVCGQCAQDILRLHDKVRALETAVPTIQDVRRAIDKADAERKKDRRKKKSGGISEPKDAGVDNVKAPVDTSRIAEYNPMTDMWVPLVIGGVGITGCVVKEVMSGQSEVPAETAAFVYDLTDDERNALCEMFPNNGEV